MFTCVNIRCVEARIYLEELCCESRDWVHLAQDKDLWWAVNESSNEPLDSMSTKLVRSEFLTVLLEGSSLVGCCASSTEHCVTTQKI